MACVCKHTKTKNKLYNIDIYRHIKKHINNKKFGYKMTSIPFRAVLNQLSTYIPGKPIEAVQKEFQLDTVIKLASNENPLGPSPHVLNVIQAALKELRLYPDGNATSLKNELANHLGVDDAQLIIGNGSDEILMLIALTFINPGDEVIISEQTFSEYLFTAKCMDASIISVAPQNFTYNLEGFSAKITPRTKVIYICNPNNPTGTIVTADELDLFLKKVPQQVLVVIDEAYYEYVQTAEYPQSLALMNTYKNLLITRTFSKIYGLAGLRIGYAIAAKTIIETLNKVREPFNVNSMAQIAAIAALHDQPYLEGIRNLNAQSKKYLYQEFEKLNIPYVQSHANFILFKPGRPAQDIFQKMMQLGVIIRAMNGFGLPEHIRVTTGTMEQNREFIYKLNKIL